MKRSQHWLETLVHGIFLILGLITVGCVLLITVYLVVSGIPAIRKIGLFPFLFGQEWASTAARPAYGILPFILTSIYGTAGAILLGVPIGFFTAVYLAKLAPPKVKAVMQTTVSLLAGIPSVVYGLVGMLVLVPGIRKLFHIPDGASLLAAIIVLAIMILPSIIKVSVTALEAVPPEYEDASLALGATPTETYFRVSAPAARSGIVAAVVLGVGAAVYLTEYATNRRLVRMIEAATETLAGIPSIIYGLVGMLFFCQFCGMQTSLQAGAMTLVIMNLPTILRTTQESLKTVPQSYREGAFGLGAGKSRVIFTVVLPNCVDGVITGCILSVGRILGESAALLFTAGFAHELHGFLVWLSGSTSGSTLTVALYVYAKERGEFDVAFAIAAILMLLTLLINLAAELTARHFKRKKAL